MVKAPSITPKNAYYSSKYKPWRRGKSKKTKVKQLGSTVNEDDPNARGNQLLSSTSCSSSSSSSLKHQLRGLERLLAKTKTSRNVQTDGGTKQIMTNEKEDDDDRGRRIQALEQSIADVKERMQQRQMTEKERSNAKKSHKSRFLDRQRLLRLWRQHEMNQQSNKNNQQRRKGQQQHNNKRKNESNTDEGKLSKTKDDEPNLEQNESNQQQQQQNESALYKLGLDMLYVAHFPHALMSYQPLFATNKKRNNPQRGRTLAKLVSARQKILPLLQCREDDKDNNDNEKNTDENDHDNGRKYEPCPWIPSMVYDQLLPQYPSDWSTQLELQTFADYPTGQQQQRKDAPQQPKRKPKQEKSGEDTEEYITTKTGSPLEGGDDPNNTNHQKRKPNDDDDDDIDPAVMIDAAVPRVKEDPRFSAAMTRPALDAVLKAADSIEAALDQEEEVLAQEEEEDNELDEVASSRSSASGDSDDDDDDDDEDHADPLVRSKQPIPPKMKQTGTRKTRHATENQKEFSDTGSVGSDSANMSSSRSISDSSSSSSSSSKSQGKASRMKRGATRPNHTKQRKRQRIEMKDESSSSSTSDSSDEENPDDESGDNDGNKHNNNSTENHRDDRGYESVKKTLALPEGAASPLIEEDGFLIPDDDDDDKNNNSNPKIDPTTIFDRAKEDLDSHWGRRRGDKSQGWATQKRNATSRNRHYNGPSNFHNRNRFSSGGKQSRTRQAQARPNNVKRHYSNRM